MINFTLWLTVCFGGKFREKRTIALGTGSGSDAGFRGDETRVIVPVHYAGVACEMDTIMALAKKHNLFVVEDAAQGVMSTYKGRALRLDVGCIGHFRVGHDGRWVRVHQNDAVTLFAQGFTCLRARVVKLTRLTDNNRARTQNQLHLHSEFNFTESRVETAWPSLRHSCRSELTRQGISLP